MPAIHFYFCRSDDHAGSDPDLECDRQRAAECYRSRLKPAGYECGRAFTDRSTAANVPFLQRGAVRALLSKVFCYGDALIVVRYDSAFCGGNDFRSAVRVLVDRGVRLIVLDPAFDTASPACKLALVLFDRHRRADRRARSRRAKRAYQARQARGRIPNQHAGYGHRLAGPKGRRYRIENPDERAVMAKIVQLRQSGRSFGQIARQLLIEGVEYEPGREWSLSRVRRGYRAELQLRAAESAAASRGGVLPFGPAVSNGVVTCDTKP